MCCSVMLWNAFTLSSVEYCCDILPSVRVAAVSCWMISIFIFFLVDWWCSTQTPPQRRLDSGEYAALLNRKVKTATDNLIEAMCRVYCLHYILGLDFAAPKSWSLVNFYMGFIKKLTLKNAVRTMINKMNIEKFKWKYTF